MGDVQWWSNRVIYSAFLRNRLAKKAYFTVKETPILYRTNQFFTSIDVPNVPTARRLCSAGPSGHQPLGHWPWTKSVWVNHKSIWWRRMWVRINGMMMVSIAKTAAEEDFERNLHWRFKDQQRIHFQSTVPWQMGSDPEQPRPVTQ